MKQNRVTEGILNPTLAGRYFIERTQLFISDLSRRAKYVGSNIKPFPPVWVDPGVITYCTVGRRAKPEDYHADIIPQFEPADQDWGQGESTTWMTRKGGDWDNCRLPVEELLIFRGIQERFVEGMDWQDTSYFHTHLNRIQLYGESMGLQTEAELIDKCRSISQLYDNIQVEGYKSQSDLGNNWRPHKEIIVNVGRDGEILFNGQGRHRLAITKVLDLDEIAVSILVMHDDYQSADGDIQIN